MSRVYALMAIVVILIAWFLSGGIDDSDHSIKDEIF